MSWAGEFGKELGKLRVYSVITKLEGGEAQVAIQGHAMKNLAPAKRNILEQLLRTITAERRIRENRWIPCTDLTPGERGIRTRGARTWMLEAAGEH